MTNDTPEADGATDEQIAELVRLEKAATPGEWSAACIDDTGGPYFYHDATGERFVVPGWDVRGPKSLGNYECGALIEADAKLIAAARNALPALLAERAKLLARIAELENVAKLPA